MLFAEFPLCSLNHFFLTARGVGIDNYFNFIIIVRSGIAEGSFFGPSLFGVYGNDIVKLDYNATFIPYADDTRLFITRRDASKGATRVKNTIRFVFKFSHSNSLCINTRKFSESINT